MGLKYVNNSKKSEKQSDPPVKDNQNNPSGGTEDNPKKPYRNLKPPFDPEKVHDNSTRDQYSDFSELDHEGLIATQHEVLTYLTACMRGEIQEEEFITKSVEPGVQVIKRLRKQVTPKDRNKAAEMLAKRYGLLNDKILLEGVKQVIFSGEEEISE